MSGKPKNKGENGWDSLLEGLMMAAGAAAVGYQSYKMFTEEKTTDEAEWLSLFTEDKPTEAKFLSLLSEPASCKSSSSYLNYEKKDEVTEGAKCNICHVNEKEVLFEPCNHVYACEDCTEDNIQTRCPKCKKQIISKKPVYLMRDEKEEKSNFGPLSRGLMMAAGAAAVGYVGYKVYKEVKPTDKAKCSSLMSQPASFPSSSSNVNYGNITERAKCVICHVNEKEVLFEPCNHLCVCEDCTEEKIQNRCPVCNRQIVSKIGVYLLPNGKEMSNFGPLSRGLPFA